MNLDAINLHDATLLGINVDWGSGVAAIKVRTHAEGDCSIVMEGCRGFRASREMPWGRSSSILKCEAVTNGQEISIVLQMQSGDEVEVRGTGVRLESGR